jgi:hypothetical protein
VLAAIVLASLSGAKGRGNDAGLKGNLGTIQVQGTLYHSIGNKYTALPGITTDCTTSDTVFKDTTTTVDDIIGIAIQGAIKNANGGSAGVYCRVKSSAFVVAAQLSTTGKYWCVDSAGAQVEKTSAPAVTNTDCGY